MGPRSLAKLFDVHVQAGEVRCRSPCYFGRLLIDGSIARDQRSRRPACSQNRRSSVHEALPAAEAVSVDRGIPGPTNPASRTGPGIGAAFRGASLVAL